MVAAAKKPKAVAVKKSRKMTPQVANAQPCMWADALYEWLSMGKTLAEFCRQPNRPTPTVIYDKLRKDDVLAARIARARDLGYDAIADECFAIADDGKNDWMESNAKNNPGWVLNGEHSSRSKLRIDTRLKLLAKWNPKKYGDKVEHDVKGTMNVVISKDDAGVL